MDGVIRVDLDGRMVEESAASVSALDRGFLYGDGLFETMRLSRFTPFLFERHWRRLAEAASFLGIPLPDEEESFERIVRLAGTNDHGGGAARLTLTRGQFPRGPRPGPSERPTVLIQTRPLPAGLPRFKAEGVAGRSLPWPLRAEGLPLQGVKSLAYLPSVLALGECGADEEPLLETTGGALSEGATSNLFWLLGKTLCTPHPDAGCLPGVARGFVMELAEREGLNLREERFTLADLREADEAFLTNAVRGVVPLVRVDGEAVGSGEPGAVTRLLDERYGEALAEAET